MTKAMSAALALAAACACVGWTIFPRAEWPSINDSIKTRWPKVPRLSTTELGTWLAGTKEKPLLLDARTRREFEVSHLQGAVRAETGRDALALARVAPRDRPIVVYCSVGYRSAGVASKLMKHGYTQVYNLEGSLFAWANEGRPVFRGTTRVAKVHPFDSKWSRLLDRRLWPQGWERS